MTSGALRPRLAAALIQLPTLLYAVTAMADRADLEGSWLQLDATRPGAPPLTAAGAAVVASYEPLRDDPDLQCKPASLTNVIGIPDPPFEIHLGADSVEINFEYMDVRRLVPLDLDVAIEEAPYTVSDHPHLGRSIGHFDGDTLVIETADITRGFLDTLRVTYPQSDEMRTVERFTADGDRLRVDITHTDSVYYTEPFDVSFEFIRVDFGILEFGCTVEAASYDDRL